MHTDAAIQLFLLTILAILVLSVLMRVFKQPHVVAYLLAGLLLGPNVLGVITDQIALNRLGSFGVVLLLFFVGMEISPSAFAKKLGSRCFWYYPASSD